MSVRCDGCTAEGPGVRRAFATFWNGNIIDLCPACYGPLIQTLDAMVDTAAKRGLIKA